MHVRAEAAHRWLETAPVVQWATCPLTENGLVRIIGHPRYPNSPGGPAVVCELLAGLRDRPGHRFWADDVSVLDPARIRRTAILSHAQVTDTYLLALACAHGGQFATFDHKVAVNAVLGGQDALHLI